MTTTTIRLEEALKLRIAAAAERAGKTSHAFMLGAISETVERDEFDRDFHRLADERWDDIQQTGTAVAWEDMKAWLEARARGETPERPAPRHFPR